MNPWIRLSTGKKFHFLAPKQEDIDIRDIALGLSRIPRFCGHTYPKPYYVGHHSCLACDYAPDDYKLVALLHDGTENWTSDCPSPLKHLLPQFKELEIRAERALARKYGLPFPFPAIIKEIDLRLLSTEQRDLIRYGNDWKNSPFIPFDKKIKAWGNEKTYREFINRFNRYYHG